MRLFIARIIDTEERKGKVYFTAHNLNDALAHMKTHFPKMTVVSIQESDPTKVIGIYHEQIKAIHDNLNEQFKRRREVAGRLEELMHKRGKSHEEMDELVELSDELRQADTDLKYMRLAVTHKQDLIKDIKGMELSCTS